MSRVVVVGEIRRGDRISTLKVIPWILREYMNAEVAMLNRGNLIPMRLEGQIHRQEIEESIRFATYVTAIEITGEQLKAAVQRSNEQTIPSRTLLTVGVDPKAETVNGRSINDAEIYSIATNDFLASGGDGYEMLKAAQRVHETGILLNEAIIEFLQRKGEEPLSVSQLQEMRSKAVWKSKGQVEVMLQGSDVSDIAKNYPQISELKSQTSGTFAIAGVQLHFSAFRAAPWHSLELSVDSQYRRLRYPQTTALELSDSTKARATFRYASPRAHVVPLVRFELEDIEFTPSDYSRVVALLGVGAESTKKIPFLPSNIKLSMGVVARRRFQKKLTTQLDLDVRGEGKWRVRGLKLESGLEWFPTFAEEGEGVLSRFITRWKSMATLPLSKGLSLNATLFIYRDTRLSSYASATALALQWGTTWGKKP